MDEKGVGVCEPPQPACSEGDRHRAGDVAPWCARKREKRCATKGKREGRGDGVVWEVRSEDGTPSSSSLKRTACSSW